MRPYFTIIFVRDPEIGALYGTNPTEIQDVRTHILGIISMF